MTNIVSVWVLLYCHFKVSAAEAQKDLYAKFYRNTDFYYFSAWIFIEKKNNEKVTETNMDKLLRF